MPARIPGDDAANHTSPPSPPTTMTPMAATEARRPGPAPVDLSPDTRTQKKAINRQSWDYVVRSGIAGGIAGCAAKTVVGPLDRVKILFQASNPQFQKYTGSWFGVVGAVRDIYGAEGTRGLFRGHGATLLRIFPYAGIKFLAYEQVRALVIRDATQETAVRRFACGSAAGMVSVVFTYPLEVIRVRLAWETKAHARTGYGDICRTIYRERSSGLSNFFRGFTPTMWGMLPYAGSSFLAHDTAGDLMRRPSLAPYTTLPATVTPGPPADHHRPADRPAQLTYWAELTTGAFAGFVSQTVSYPLEVVRRRMQVGGVVGDGRRLGMAEVAAGILRTKGLPGFYVGLGIGYAKVVPMASVSFYAYERAKYLLGI